MAPGVKKFSRHARDKQGPRKQIDKTDSKNAPKRVSFKNQIRSLKRLLNKKDLPEEVRKAKEQQMAELESRVRRAQQLEKYRLRHKKTAAIRFFERRKAERKLDKAKKALAMLPESADEGTRNRLEKRVEEAQNNVYYVKHFPINKKYISLFVKSEHQDAKADKKIQRIRERILQKLAEKRKADEDEAPYDSDKEDDEDAHDDFFLHSDSDDSSCE